MAGLGLPLRASADGPEGPVGAGDASEFTHAVGAAGVDQEGPEGGKVGGFLVIRA